MQARETLVVKSSYLVAEGATETLVTVDSPFVADLKSQFDRDLSSPAPVVSLDRRGGACGLQPICRHLSARPCGAGA
jgi:hypothetical protein